MAVCILFNSNGVDDKMATPMEFGTNSYDLNQQLCENMRDHDLAKKEYARSS